jgi:hypothetical protein
MIHYLFFLSADMQLLHRPILPKCRQQVRNQHRVFGIRICMRTRSSLHSWKRGRDQGPIPGRDRAGSKLCPVKPMPVVLVLFWRVMSEHRVHTSLDLETFFFPAFTSLTK